MKRPSACSAPILTILPSLTAIDRRAVLGVDRDAACCWRRTSTGTAALAVLTRVLAACDGVVGVVGRGGDREVALVRPVSEPMSSVGMPPISWARSSTESTYQPAWL